MNKLFLCAGIMNNLPHRKKFYFNKIFCCSFGIIYRAPTREIIPKPEGLFIIFDERCAPVRT